MKRRSLLRGRDAGDRVADSANELPLALRTIRMANVAPFISSREFCGRSDKVEYCLSRPLVFSFDPRCHGPCGSQKYTSILVAKRKSALPRRMSAKDPIRKSAAHFVVTHSRRR